MATRLLVLDESKSTKHPILSVGGFLVHGDAIPELEARWTAAKTDAGLANRQVRYAMSWPDRKRRSELLAVVGDLPIVCIAALLEDFRPPPMKERPATRGEWYIHLRAFEYILQRLPEAMFHDADCAPNFVLLDDRDDFKRFAGLYSKRHGTGWQFPSGKKLPPLARLGYTKALHSAQDGPLIEVADMTASCITRWAGARAAHHRGRKVHELDELDQDAATIMRRFPASQTAIPVRRQGFSLITHVGSRTGREILEQNIDRWARELPPPSPPSVAVPNDDIPF